MSSAYIIFQRRKRFMWFGPKWEVAHVASTIHHAREWLLTTWRNHHLFTDSFSTMHRHYRLLTCSIDNAPGKGWISQPANTTDIFWTPHVYD